MLQSGLCYMSFKFIFTLRVIIIQKKPYSNPTQRTDVLQRLYAQLFGFRFRMFRLNSDSELIIFRLAGKDFCRTAP